MIQKSIETNKYVCSKYVHIFKKDDFIALFHSLAVKEIYGKKLLSEIYFSFRKPTTPANFLKKYSNSRHKLIMMLLSVMINLKFLVKNRNEDRIILEKIIKAVPNKFQLRTIFLSVTNKCNFQCKYCIIINNQTDQTNFQNMDMKLAIKSINYFFRKAVKDRKKQIVFFGGEPLINLPVVKFIIPYIRKKENEKMKTMKDYQPTRIFFMTNGTFVTRELAVFFNKYKVYPIVSLDGPRDIHNKMRVSACSGTFDDVLKGYKIFKKEKCIVSACITVNSHNIETLPDIVKYVSQELKPASSSTNLPQRSMKNKNDKSFDIIDSLASTKLIESFKVARQYGLYITKYIMDNRVRPFVEESPKLKFCGGAGSRIVIEPDGRLSPCQGFSGMHKKYKENLLNNPDIKRVVGTELIKHSVFNIITCHKCPAISVCGGFCPYKTKIISDTVKIPDKSTCLQSRSFLNFLIWDLFDIIDKAGKLKNIDNKLYYIPDKKDKLKIFGKINVRNVDKENLVYF